MGNPSYSSGSNQPEANEARSFEDVSKELDDMLAAKASFEEDIAEAYERQVKVDRLQEALANVAMINHKLTFSLTANEINRLQDLREKIIKEAELTMD